MAEVTITTELVRALVDEQFPRWAGLPIEQVHGGWDNRCFRIGDELVARLPSAARYAAQAVKEQAWLPKLAPALPLPVSAPVGLGRPGQGYPFNWSVLRWIEGETLAAAAPADLVAVACDLGEVLAALARVDPSGGPTPWPDNFGRGGPPNAYDGEVRQALARLGGRIDGARAARLWDAAMEARWEGAPVWLHGDVTSGNLLVREGQLAAVIDWGLCAVGDPACDLAIGWTFFDARGRAALREAVGADAGAWARGIGWALWKTLIVRAGLAGTNPADDVAGQRVLRALGLG